MTETPGISSSSSSKEDASSTAEDDRTSLWIDQNVNGENDLRKTIDFLANLTIPTEPAKAAPSVAPFNGPLDGQLWPWNRAAQRLDRKNLPLAAAEVNAAMYLAIIALQKKYKLRFHKGMPRATSDISWGKAILRWR